MTTATEILEALEQHLRKDVQGELSGMLAYQNRIAANLLGILRRGEVLGEQLDALDRDFADKFELDAEHMPASLARALRNGKLQDSPDLRSYLRRRSLLVLAIDNPRYSTFNQARSAWPEAKESS